jgi:hypothetical protein
MPVSELHRQVAAVALGAAAEHGFALGGGNALLAHGVISLYRRHETQPAGPGECRAVTYPPSITSTSPG